MDFSKGQRRREGKGTGFACLGHVQRVDDKSLQLLTAKSVASNCLTTRRSHPESQSYIEKRRQMTTRHKLFLIPSLLLLFRSLQLHWELSEIGLDFKVKRLLS